MKMSLHGVLKGNSISFAGWPQTEDQNQDLHDLLITSIATGTRQVIPLVNTAFEFPYLLGCSLRVSNQYFAASAGRKEGNSILLLLGWGGGGCGGGGVVRLRFA